MRDETVQRLERLMGMPTAPRMRVTVTATPCDEDGEPLPGAGTVEQTGMAECRLNYDSFEYSTEIRWRHDPKTGRAVTLRLVEPPRAQ
jgi:hypothetical protein